MPWGACLFSFPQYLSMRKTSIFNTHLQTRELKPPLFLHQTATFVGKLKSPGHIPARATYNRWQIALLSMNFVSISPANARLIAPRSVKLAILTYSSLLIVQNYRVKDQSPRLDYRQVNAPHWPARAEGIFWWSRDYERPVDLLQQANISKKPEYFRKTLGVWIIPV